ncbi:hypothetical protein OIU84_001145 [Salix udensis]|uniref:MBD domain-containing protein n=1 Tax=Salix udensis TaxID=889485 RepID=A0AAD6K6S8_9ROSI|nr:hypothetical protein OIU84_001145 [Salix udensis]
MVTVFGLQHLNQLHKFYFPPSGGCRFNSKIEVSRYLNGSHPNSEQKERSNDRRHSNEVVIEKTVPEGLPLGWTKEIKVTKKGGRIRRDLLSALLKSNCWFKLLFPCHVHSPAVSEQQGLEVHKKQNPVIGDQSLKSWEIAKDDQILTSVSSGECIAGYGRTSDQCMSAAKRQNVKVDGIQSSIVSDQSPNTSPYPRNKSWRSAEHQVKLTPISTISDQSLKSCEIAKDEQMLNSASTGECIVISKHTSGGVGTESSSSEIS